jgi:hypothetical protein
MVRARGLVGAATAAAWVLGVWGRGVGTVRRRSSAVAARGRRAAQCPGGATARLRGSAGRGVTKGIVLIRVRSLNATSRGEPCSAHGTLSAGRSEISVVT